MTASLHLASQFAVNAPEARPAGRATARAILALDGSPIDGATYIDAMRPAQCSPGRPAGAASLRSNRGLAPFAPLCGLMTLKAALVLRQRSTAPARLLATRSPDALLVTA
ncbi:hypothetical protein LK07_02510 [Streptomyces pluripotens]|uniref:Uncharacterized protein n=1 Tax=Streptomyces pluripotens TaxID=1355015 RepID=A0A221NSZ4_9ACTN|nr:MULTISPECIES: hypothetical protein [Streptomyces]ARP68826.1 hypothetical protein LK06_001425 [Streptomyces pluripotens]ASN23081.1 hypothetical protein LK07_02510 [Streptomyces pluripotens]KIE25256.1 hypothetical protein LK08_20400 [Streptomyces sp. MUSC 125]MCH0556802.1 hypothetical protein [Streptomyces sp. MUM 16J]